MAFSNHPLQQPHYYRDMQKNNDTADTPKANKAPKWRFFCNSNNNNNNNSKQKKSVSPTRKSFSSPGIRSAITENDSSSNCSNNNNNSCYYQYGRTITSPPISQIQVQKQKRQQQQQQKKRKQQNSRSSDDSMSVFTYLNEADKAYTNLYGRSLQACIDNTNSSTVVGDDYSVISTWTMDPMTVVTRQEDQQQQQQHHILNNNNNNNSYNPNGNNYKNINLRYDTFIKETESLSSFAYVQRQQQQQRLKYRQQKEVSMISMADESMFTSSS